MFFVVVAAFPLVPVILKWPPILGGLASTSIWG
jgi:hypothetical protein